MSRYPSPAVAAKRRRVLALTVLLIIAAAAVLASGTGTPANGLHFTACLTLAGTTMRLILEFEQFL